MHLNKITSLSDTIKSLHAHIETWDLYHAKDDTSKYYLVPSINISFYSQFCRYVNVPQGRCQVAPSIHLFLSRSIKHNHLMRNSTQS